MPCEFAPRFVDFQALRETGNKHFNLFMGTRILLIGIAKRVNASWLAPKLLTLSIILMTLGAYGQDEFMLYGRVRLPDGSADSIKLVSTSDTEEDYEKEIYVTGRGEYRLFFKYGNEYELSFSHEGFIPLSFTVSTDFPEGVKECCQTPLEMSFHLFEPGSEYDSIFYETLHEIEYVSKLKGYNYDVDIDYKVQKMLIDEELKKQQAIYDAKRQLEIADSMAIERQYLDLINKGNLYFATENWAQSKQMFLKALEVKPKRRYPKYKLEDIKTAVELFNKSNDSVVVNIDTVVAPEIIEAPVAPRKFVYTPPSDDEIERLFKQDLVKQIAKESGSDSVANARIAFISEILDEVLEPVKPAIIKPQIAEASIETFTPVVIEKEETVEVLDTVAEPEPIVVQEVEEKPQYDHSFNDKKYQDSLLVKYPDYKTVEVEELETKTITRIYINSNNRVTIYMAVEHNWGSTFYFIDRTPLVPENISKAYFESKTFFVDSLPATGE